MRRREVLKGITSVAGSALLPGVAWSSVSAEANGEASFAVPIRGLINRGGKMLQPIQITVQLDSAAEVLTKLNGSEVDKRNLAAGSQTFQVFTSPVTTPQTLTVDVAAGEKRLSSVVTLQPVRKVVVYVLPHSHHDLGYTDIQSKIEEKQMHNITLGMELARKTAEYPEGARFIWNLEVLWGADLFMRRKSPAEKAEFLAAVKKGWISLNGMYANELTGLCRPEELLELFRYAHELGSQCGVRVDSAMISDVPGYTWGTVSAMAQAGIRYFSPAPNYFDRIGSIMVEWQDKPFWHVSRSGKEKVLVWVPWTGYALSHVEKEMSLALVAKYQDRLDQVNYPYDISYMRWSGHGDNAEPDPQICEFLKMWNTTYEWPKFVISSTSTAFAAFEKRHGAQLPRLRGDLTPYWEDGAGSSALETRINRNAADRLTQGETLEAMLSRPRSKSLDFSEAWRNILLYSEHTWGASASIRDPEAPMTKAQWAVKRQFALDAEKESTDLEGEVLRAYGTSKDESVVDVHNTTSWPRTELVVLAAASSKAGDRVSDDKGRPVPSQRLSTGELAFLASEVPCFATARFHVSAGEPHVPAKRVSFKNDVLENGLLGVRVDRQTGDLVEIKRHGKAENFVDPSSGERLNQFLFLEGNDVSKVQKSGPVNVSLEEAGPLVATVRIEGSAPGCKSLVRRVRMIAGADWIELSNTVDKNRAPINPHPDNPAAAGEFAQHHGKESVQFAFPFAVPGGKMHMDIPLAEMEPEADQLPGSCKNWLPVGRWIDVSNDQRGVTWVSLDAPLVELGSISATMLGSQRNPSVWRKQIEPTQKIYSWVMNNHWGTNYRAYQEGPVEFRYAIRPNDGYDAAAASRFAIGRSQPLVVSAAGAGAPLQSVLRIEPENVLALTLRESRDGTAWMLRLFAPTDEAQKARVHWSEPAPRKVWLSDLSEKPIQPVEQEIVVNGWDIVTLRAERSGEFQ